MGALDDEQLHGLRLQAEVEGPLAVLRAATSVKARGTAGAVTADRGVVRTPGGRDRSGR